MAAGKYDFTIEQGATWNPVLTYKDPLGNPVDLTGYTARLMAREDYDSDEPYIEITTENGGITLGGVAGTIALLLDADDTADITVKIGRYDLEIQTGTTVLRLLQGVMILSREVTRV